LRFASHLLFLRLQPSNSFPSGGLRVIIAFLVFYLLPIAGAVLYARNTLLIPLEWLFVSLRVVLADGPTIAMNAGEFQGVQPDHHGL
jgi:hypothetical protein